MTSLAQVVGAGVDDDRTADDRLRTDEGELRVCQSRKRAIASQVIDTMRVREVNKMRSKSDSEAMAVDPAATKTQ